MGFSSCQQLRGIEKWPLSYLLNDLGLIHQPLLRFQAAIPGREVFVTGKSILVTYSITHPLLPSVLLQVSAAYVPTYLPTLPR